MQDDGGKHPRMTTGDIDSTPDLWREGAAVLPARGDRVARLDGTDARDFLQRMTTNDMREVGPHQSRVTALLSPVGRIETVFTVIQDEDGFWLIAEPEGAARLRSLLQAHIFFMDEVSVRNASEDWRYIELVGHGASHIVSLLGMSGAEPQDGAVQRQGEMLAVYQAHLELPGFGLLVPAARHPQVLHAIQQAHGVLWQTLRPFHRERIRQGKGGFGTEFTGAYNPLEVGLAWICAENKGCYPGQEIIARQITYDKVTRGLVRLTSDAALPLGEDVWMDGKKAGTITSTVQDPATGAHMALSVMKRSQIRPDHAPTVGAHSVQMEGMDH